MKDILPIFMFFNEINNQFGKELKFFEMIMPNNQLVTSIFLLSSTLIHVYPYTTTK